MKHKNCPECGEQMQADVRRCPRCGAVLNLQASKKWVYVFAIVVFVAIVYAGVTQ